MEITTSEKRFVIACFENGENAFNYWAAGETLGLDQNASDALAFRLRDIGIFHEPAYQGECGFIASEMPTVRKLYERYAATPEYWTDEQRRFLRRIFQSTEGRQSEVYVEAMSIGSGMTAARAREVAEQLQRRGVIELTMASQARVSNKSFRAFVETFRSEGTPVQAEDMEAVRDQLLIAALDAEPSALKWHEWIEENGQTGNEDDILDPLQTKGFVSYNSIGLKLSVDGRAKAKEIKQQSVAVEVPPPAPLPIVAPSVPSMSAAPRSNRIAAFFGHNITSGIIVLLFGFGFVFFVYKKYGVNLNDPTYAKPTTSPVLNATTNP